MTTKRLSIGSYSCHRCGPFDVIHSNETNLNRRCACGAFVKLVSRKLVPWPRTKDLP